MAKVAKRTIIFLVLSQSLIEPLKCQLAVPGMFFALQSGELLSPSKDEVNIWQEFFECGMDTQCSDVATYTTDAKSEESDESEVQEESLSGDKKASWKKMQGNNLRINPVFKIRGAKAEDFYSKSPHIRTYQIKGSYSTRMPCTCRLLAGLCSRHFHGP